MKKPIKAEPWMDKMIDRLVHKMKNKEEDIHFRDDDVFNESSGWNAYGILEQRGLLWGDSLIHVEFEFGYEWQGDHVLRVPANEMVLRQLLFLYHGCPMAKLYHKDGEMQCSRCKIDFKRNSVKEINKKYEKLPMVFGVRR